MIDAEERTRQGTPALSANQQGLAGKTGKDLCTGSALSWIAVVASNRFPPCILPLFPSVLNAAEKWAFSVRFQTMWLQLSEPSHSFLPRSTWEHKPWQCLTRSCHDWPHGHLWLLMVLSHWPPWFSSNVAHSTVRPPPHLLPAWHSHPPSLRGSPRALRFCLCLTFSKLPAPLSLDLPCLPTRLLPSSSFSPCFIYYFSL